MNTKIFALNLETLEEYGDASQLLDRLPSWRRKAVLRLKSPAARLQSAGAGLLLYSALEYCGFSPLYRVALTEKQKPFFPEHPELYFNLSHSGKRALCIIGDQENGCDVETARAYRPEIAERFFGPSDREYLENAPEAERDAVFCRLWTLKESFMKATGLGMSLGLSDFTALPHESEPQRVLQNVNKNGYYTREYLLGDGYYYSACQRDRNFPTEIIWLDAHIQKRINK